MLTKQTVYCRQWTHTAWPNEARAKDIPSVLLCSLIIFCYVTFEKEGACCFARVRSVGSPLNHSISFDLYAWKFPILEQELPLKSRCSLLFSGLMIRVHSQTDAHCTNVVRSKCVDPFALKSPKLVHRLSCVPCTNVRSISLVSKFDSEVATTK